MTSNTDILTRAGFKNVSAMIDAANAVGIPLWIAAAFVQKESNGQNIYGHDAGGVFSGAGPVTNSNYNQFYDRVVNQHQRSNGVGPMQITWPGFLTDAKRQGLNLADPRDNFVYGFKLIRGYLGGNYSRASIANAGTRYNGASAYGASVASMAASWQGKLVKTVAPSNTASPTLREGSKGNAVRSLQRGLNRVFPAYSRLTVDGDFGPSTEKVVVEFQTRSGLVPDGVVGLNTRAKLNAVGIAF